MESVSSYCIAAVVLIFVLRALIIGLYKHDFEDEQGRSIEELLHDLAEKIL